ncbi:MAG: DUF47 family protein [Magnetococcales bacterium]|nr:DUF47 family protein [Magnetococcales bacterium]
MSETSTIRRSKVYVDEGPPPSLMKRILANVFPEVPDFFSLLDDQCVLMVEAMDALVAFMEKGDEQSALLVREIEKKGDVVKARNLSILGKAFATPLDREDIYRAITNIDMIINYAKTTVREVEMLQMTPDPYALEMANIMSRGAFALQRGFAKLSYDPLGAVEDARAATASEHEVETSYRKALARMFDTETRVSRMKEKPTENLETLLMEQTILMFKRRELYRHLSNVGDNIAKTSTVLYDIMVQV